MALFKPYKVTENQLAAIPIKDGQFIFTTDTKKIYLDKNDTERILALSDTTYEVATQLANGLMSKEDKKKLDSITEGAQVNVQADWAVTDTQNAQYINNKPTSMPASDVYAWAKEENKPEYSYDEVGAEPFGAAAASQSNANEYTDQKISELINGAPETLDTLKEVADAIAEHKEVTDALDSAIGNKVDKVGGGRVCLRMIIPTMKRAN